MTEHPADPPSPLTAAGKKLLEILMIQAHHVSLAPELTQDFPARIRAIEVEAVRFAETALHTWAGHIDCDAADCTVAHLATLDAARAPDAGLRDALLLHYITAIDCDHEAKTDTVRCNCSVWTGTPQPSVGAAVAEWVDHVLALASAPSPAGPSVEDEARERAGEWNRHARWMADTGQSAVRTPYGGRKASVPADPPSPLTAEEEADLRKYVEPDAPGFSWTHLQMARLLATLDAARAPDAGLRAALEAIINLPTVVPDHPHGGVHPPYLEWMKVAAIARAATRPAEEPVWLIERGQAEHHVPTVWRTADGTWTTDANEAERFASRSEAQRVIEANSLIGNRDRIGRASEHIFLATRPAEDAGARP